MDAREFVELFTADRDVVFAFHGYAGAVHQLLHGRPNAEPLPRARLQRGGHDHDAVRHGRAQRDEPLPPLQARRSAAPEARARTRAERSSTHCDADARSEHRGYVVEHFEDMPEVRDWTWPT